MEEYHHVFLTSLWTLGSRFSLNFTFPSLVVSLHSLPFSNPFHSPSSQPSFPPPLPTPSSPGRLQIGYFLHAPCRALISVKCWLLVCLSGWLTVEAALLKCLIWSMFVCGALSPHLILTALTVCAGSLSPSFATPFPLPLSSVSIASPCSVVFQPAAQTFSCGSSSSIFVPFVVVSTLKDHKPHVIACFLFLAKAAVTLKPKGQSTQVEGKKIKLIRWLPFNCWRSLQQLDVKYLLCIFYSV